jgi:hypothetical protein
MCYMRCSRIMQDTLEGHSALTAGDRYCYCCCCQCCRCGWVLLLLGHSFKP